MLGRTPIISSVWSGHPTFKTVTPVDIVTLGYLSIAGVDSRHLNSSSSSCVSYPSHSKRVVCGPLEANLGPLCTREGCRRRKDHFSGTEGGIPPQAHCEGRKKNARYSIANRLPVLNGVTLLMYLGSFSGSILGALIGDGSGK